MGLSQKGLFIPSVWVYLSISLLNISAYNNMLVDLGITGWSYACTARRHNSILFFTYCCESGQPNEHFNTLRSDLRID